MIREWGGEEIRNGQVKFKVLVCSENSVTFLMSSGHKFTREK